MTSILGRLVGMLFAATALLVLVFWLADGSPLPQSWGRSFDEAYRDDRLFVNTYFHGDDARAAEIRRRIIAAGYPVVDTLEGAWAPDRHDFVIPLPVSRAETHLMLTKLGREVPGVEFIISSEYAAYFEGNLRHGKYTFGSLLVSSFEDRYGASARVVQYSVAASLVATGLLALWLLLRMREANAVRNLGLGLSCWSLSLAYAYFFSVAPTFARYQPGTLTLRIALDVLSFEILMLAAYSVARFWHAYPRPVSDEELHRFLQALKKEQLKVVGSARRRWLRRLLRRGPAEGDTAEPAAETPAVPFKGTSLARRLAPVLGVGLFIGLAWTGSFLLPGLAPLIFIELPLWCFVILAFWLLCVIPLRLFKYHRAVGTVEDQRKVEWVWAAIWMAFVMIITPVSMLAFLYVGSYFVPSLDDWIDLTVVLVTLGFTLGPVVIVISLGLSILYRGTADPRLALRGVTVFTLLGLVLTLVFVFVERTIAVRLVKLWGLPSQTGLVTAGALVAATFQPVRRFSEKHVTRFVERVLPASVLASGTRHTLAVAVVDISGYTALSAKDEQAALLASTLVQKEARRLSDQHGGRVVKSTGDGVIMCFADPQATLTAVLELHRSTTKAGAAMNISDLRLHSGLHWGEIIEMHDGDIYGMSVNVTARIADWAKAREIGVSQAFFEKLMERNEGFASMGPQSFKNVPEPVVCYRLADA